MANKVTYHPEPGRSIEFDVLGTNSDKTVNIGLANDPNNQGKSLTVIRSCKITNEVVIGSATETNIAKDSKSSK